MKQQQHLILALCLASLAHVSAAHAGTIGDAVVSRDDRSNVTINWTDKDAVDVFMADRADADIASATLISGKDKDGRHVVALDNSRRYFLLRDVRDGGVVRVAERLVPLEKGSNFRDIGGYVGADNKHVRWGMIYRSGGTPLLTDADVQDVRALGLRNLVDLRSSEERVIAPTRLDGIPYSAIGYSMAAINGSQSNSTQIQNGGAIYRNFPTLLAPQMRLLFAKLLARADAPLAYNCSAGQDRTGFATAMILSALGVPRETILQDYHLSTSYRRPANEMPKIDVVAHANNPVALFFAKYQQDPAAAQPKPLYSVDHKSYLIDAFEEIEAKWGSVDTYLAKEAGVTTADVATLRAHYLE